MLLYTFWVDIAKHVAPIALLLASGHFAVKLLRGSIRDPRRLNLHLHLHLLIVGLCVGWWLGDPPAFLPLALGLPLLAAYFCLIFLPHRRAGVPVVATAMAVVLIFLVAVANAGWPPPPPDRTPPVLAVPHDIVMKAWSTRPIRVWFPVTARDSVDPHPSIVCNPRSGSRFTIGRKKVTCVATDRSGNSRKAAFQVRVIGPQHHSLAALKFWRQVCGEIYPGDGAPKFASQQLYDLYLGFGGPGATAGGCTGEVVYPDGHENQFVYQVGVDKLHRTELPMSIAVDSPLYGPAIFFRPAINVVESVIDSVDGPVGGAKLLHVGNGDVVLIYDEAGTIALVRPQVTEPGRPKFAYPYVVLGPAATDAWVDAMRYDGRWLWPSKRPNWPGSWDLIDLSTIGEPVETIHVSRADSEAYRLVNGHMIYYHGGLQITRDELQQISGSLAKD